jgi:hypothetical protein
MEEFQCRALLVALPLVKNRISGPGNYPFHIISGAKSSRFHQCLGNTIVYVCNVFLLFSVHSFKMYKIVLFLSFSDDFNDKFVSKAGGFFVHFQFIHTW